MMKKLICATALTLALAANAAMARELRIAPAAPPAHPAGGVLYPNFAKYVEEESEGRLTARILGPEVVNLVQMKDALQDQIVDVGNLLPLYFPADLPNMAMAGELALSGSVPHAMGAAVTEYTVTCGSCIEESKRLGFVYLGSGSSNVYNLLTTRPVVNPEDLRGLRLRSGGAPFSRWAENFGASPVNIQVNDTFESMSQGVIDGTIASVADMLSFRLIELVTSVTVLPLGTFHSTSNFAVGNATWAELSAEDRAAMIRAANRANADFTQRWGYEMEGIANEAARGAGIEYLEPSEALLEASNAFREQDVQNAIDVSRDTFGLADSDERVARFLELVDKWTAIVEEVGADPAAIAARVQEEVWDKVDPATYGL